MKGLRRPNVSPPETRGNGLFPAGVKIVGHLLKTRAAVNYILYNRLTDELGTGSYELDIPNGGTSYVIGNLIQQGLESGNEAIISYLEEGVDSQNPGMQLYPRRIDTVSPTSVGLATPDPEELTPLHPLLIP